MLRVRRETRPITQDLSNTLRCIQWLADSNYEMHFSPKLAMSERIIFPVSTNESNGIEDARFVRFVEDDGTAMYYATYTAYNGHAILPQLIETQDFLHFRVLTLNGTAVQNKGMALFPRRIDGNYAMLSRQDDENLFIMFSDNPHYWSDSAVLLRPAEMWESVKIGNCGSPIETEAGWLVITHGVGPMRKYCIGAALLDLNDPTQGHRAPAGAPAGARGQRQGRLRAQRRLQLRFPPPRARPHPALRHERQGLGPRQRPPGRPARRAASLSPLSGPETHADARSPRSPKISLRSKGLIPSDG